MYTQKDENDPFCYVKVYNEEGGFRYCLHLSFDDHDLMTDMYDELEDNDGLCGDGWRIISFDAPWETVKAFYGDNLHVLVNTLDGCEIIDTYRSMNNLVKGLVDRIGIMACDAEALAPIREGKPIKVGSTEGSCMVHVLNDAEIADGNTYVNAVYECRIASPAD